MPELDAFFKAEHQARTRSEELLKLRDLTGNKAYAHSELARKDHYVEPYFGKEYGHGEAKEVMTMAFQYVLGDNADEFKQLFKKDRELFSMVVGLLGVF